MSSAFLWNWAICCIHGNVLICFSKLYYLKSLWQQFSYVFFEVVSYVTFLAAVFICFSRLCQLKSLWQQLSSVFLKAVSFVFKLKIHSTETSLVWESALTVGFWLDMLSGSAPPPDLFLVAPFGSLSGFAPPLDLFPVAPFGSLSGSAPPPDLFLAAPSDSWFYHDSILKPRPSGHLKSGPSGHLKSGPSGHLKFGPSGHLESEFLGYLKSRPSGHLNPMTWVILNPRPLVICSHFLHLLQSVHLQTSNAIFIGILSFEGGC
jgi:hypothetical protein